MKGQGANQALLDATALSKHLLSSNIRGKSHRSIQENLRGTYKNIVITYNNNIMPQSQNSFLAVRVRTRDVDTIVFESPE